METKFNKTTLIIDGNWLLMSRLGVMMGQFSRSLPPEHLEQAKNEMVDFVAQSINKIISYWGGNIDNIMMVQDGGSWRKTIAKPTLYTEEYKGNRVHDEEIAWDYIWDALKHICQNFKTNKISCIQDRNIEGDDWCWYWSKYLNRMGTNTIIWTSDADLKQLVQKDPVTGAWTAWFNDRSGLVLNEAFNRSDMDVLLNFDATDPFIDEVMRRAQKYTFVNPDDIVMQKVICGDSGDNIKSLVRVESTTKTGKTITKRVSEKEWLQVKQDLGITCIQEFRDRAKDIIKALLRIQRFSGCKDSIQDLMDMFNYNMALVYLDKSEIPVEYQKKMNAHREEYLMTDMGFLRNNYKVLATRTESVEKLFEDVPF